MKNEMKREITVTGIHLFSVKGKGCNKNNRIFFIILLFENKKVT